MIYTKQAIKLAVEGGYKSPCCNRDVKLVEHLAKHTDMVFLDPLFWQALGKAMGKGLIAIKDIDVSGNPLSRYEYWWQYHWHRFIDYLAVGKNAEEFFKELLKEKGV